MKISWILWWIISVFWIVVILSLTIYSLLNGLTINNQSDFFKFFCLLIGLFIFPFIIQLLWLVINILVKIFK